MRIFRKFLEENQGHATEIRYMSPKGPSLISEILFSIPHPRDADGNSELKGLKIRPVCHFISFKGTQVGSLQIVHTSS